MESERQGGIGQLGGLVFAGAPAKDAAAAKVHLGSEIEPAFASLEGSHVGELDLVVPLGRTALVLTQVGAGTAVAVTLRDWQAREGFAVAKGLDEGVALVSGWATTALVSL